MILNLDDTRRVPKDRVVVLPRATKNLRQEKFCPAGELR